MNSFNKSDKEFINGVWNKVRYMEMKKEEEEKVKENIKRIRKERFKLCVSFIFLIIAILLPILRLEEMNAGVIYIISLVLISGSLIYDYFFSKKIFGGNIQ